jgi:hypothetical protein
VGLALDVSISVPPDLWQSVRAYRRYQRRAIIGGRVAGLLAIGAGLGKPGPLVLGFVLVVIADLLVLTWTLLNRQVLAQPLRLQITAGGLTWSRGESIKSAPWASLRTVRRNRDYWFFKTSARGLLMVPKSAASPEDRASVEQFLATSERMSAP